MWNKEEVEGAIDDLGLLNETVVNVGSLWWVRDTSVGSNLEESLSDSLVNDDESVLW